MCAHTGNLAAQPERSVRHTPPRVYNKVDQQDLLSEGSDGSNQVWETFSEGGPSVKSNKGLQKMGGEGWKYSLTVRPPQEENFRKKRVR